MGLCQAALGGPSAIYQNTGVIIPPTVAPVVDARIFLNTGIFEAATVIGTEDLNPLPYMTTDTLFFTNTSSGIMVGFPGFQFDTGTSTSRHSASSFFNAGIVEGLDLPGVVVLDSPVGAGTPTTAVPNPAESRPVSSRLVVQASNIVNTGDMAVGDCGLLRLMGVNVTNAYATLTAGEVNSSTLTDQNTTGLQGQQTVVAGPNKLYYFLGSPGVYDIFWGVTNALNLRLASFNPINPPLPTITPRANSVVPSFPPNAQTALWNISVYSNIVDNTNIYLNFVFLNANFADTNISASVGFAKAAFPQDSVTDTTDDRNAYEAIVQFSEPVHDIITGATVSNSIYLLDNGADLPSMALADDVSVFEGYSRPNAFEVTTVTPSDWLAASPSNFVYSPLLFFDDQEFQNDQVTYIDAVYGAQVGRNPINLSGSFTTLVNLPDPTNDYARIEIDAQNLDITHARLRAEGMVVLNVTNNLIGGGNATVDWGEMNAKIGAANGSLLLSNVFPSTFQRLRGDIYAWSGTWQNAQTNLGSFQNSNNVAPATNTIHYHVLVVDQNLSGSFPSTVRSLSLTGRNSIVLQDNVNVIDKAVLNTTNLAINSTVTLSQNAQDFLPANVPSLRNLLIGPNGALEPANILDVGLNMGLGQTAPAGRAYPVNSITNFGLMMASADLLQSLHFENDGSIFSIEGSIVIDADTLGMGLAQTNAFNDLEAFGNVSLSASSIEARNSIISAGFAGRGALNLYATKQLTDHVSGIPTTNTNSVLINNWSVTAGFSLPVKPASGDLFGTEIRTMTTNFDQATHVWAGADRGPTLAGFINNEVIGRLVMDRQSSNSVLHFSAAGAQNAMYVDYLEFDDDSTNYHATDRLVIDPNFTIYFADSNLDPEKLAATYPNRLVWVRSFVGPNSTQVVPYVNSSVVCLMNAAVANSPVITFWGNVANYNLLLTTPYLLNNPNNLTQFLPCPGIYNYPCNCEQGTNAYSLLFSSGEGTTNLVMDLLTISANGNGSVSPVLTQSQLALGQSYVLTAKPATGWVFDGWATFGLNGAINSNTPTLSFTFVTNTVITANFIPTPFPALKGVYSGLFFNTNAVDPGSSGAFSLTLASSGTFSGQLLMGPATYRFVSQFFGDGNAQFQTSSGGQTLTVNLQLDITGQTRQILGDVAGNTWDAALVANIAPIWTAKNPSPLAGSYTMALPWATGTVVTPGGDSYGAGAVSKLGVLTMAGALSDGATFSASAPVSQDGQWPFYFYTAARKDTVLGWVAVTNGLTGTNISWSKLAGTGSLYPDGFTNLLQLTGSAWHAPAKNSPALTLFNPFVTLSGGDLSATVTDFVTLPNHLTYAATNLTLSVSAANGTFGGSFINPDTRRKQTILGVVLQNEDDARGFFLGTDQSGAVLLQGQ